MAFYSTGDVECVDGDAATLWVFVKAFGPVPPVGRLVVGQRAAGGTGHSGEVAHQRSTLNAYFCSEMINTIQYNMITDSVYNVSYFYCENMTLKEQFNQKWKWVIIYW